MYQRLIFPVVITLKRLSMCKRVLFCAFQPEGFSLSSRDLPFFFLLTSWIIGGCSAQSVLNYSFGLILISQHSPSGTISTTAPNITHILGGISYKWHHSAVTINYMKQQYKTRGRRFCFRSYIKHSCLNLDIGHISLSMTTQKSARKIKHNYFSKICPNV